MVTTTVEKSTTKPKSLYQRIADVQAELDSITPTGTNQYKAAAISIDDVENLLRAKLGAAGVVTRWSYLELAEAGDRLWRAHLRVTVASAEDREDCFEDEWIDVGGNPMAATSFARKGYLKALFHLSEKDDETGSQPTSGRAATTQAQRGTSTAGVAPSSTPAARAASSSRPASNGTDKRPIREPIMRDENPVGCPTCGTGTLELVLWPDGNRQISCSDWKSCGYREKVPDESTAAEHVAAVAGAVSAAAGGDVDPDSIPF